MPAKDIYHETVKKALITDGWTITHDPFRLDYGTHRVYADLGAEKLLAAERANRKIIVEVKSFRRPSEVEDLKEAFGAYGLYRNILIKTEADYELYLAVSVEAYEGVFSAPLGRLLVELEDLRLLVFDPQTEEISQWIP